MKYFVQHNSIVRTIWGKSDTVLLIFAGASAEFALNKAVDWLYFTGRLPADPMGRLFSTVAYAKKIVFSEESSAMCTIDTMSEIHHTIEEKRGTSIPDWAYRDVLFMLIDYSIRSFETLERKLSEMEKEEVFNVFYHVGSRMELKELPGTFEKYEKMRQRQIQLNLQQSHYTDHLFTQYRKHLGAIRYRILLEVQILVVPQNILKLHGFRQTSYLAPLIGLYKLGRRVRADRMLKALLLPSKYKSKIKALDKVTSL